MNNVDKTPRSSTYRHWPWAVAVALSFATAFGAIEITRALLERNHKNELAAEVKRRAIDIMAVTLNGNVMGTSTAMGLVDQSLKRVARGEIPPEDPQAFEVLRSIGEYYGATGTYVINRSGIVQSNWYSTGNSLTGLDVSYRPYFQIALQGKANVYAAIGTTTGQRALYFAAPLFDAVSTRSAIIGATVIRMDVDRVDSVLNAWPGPGLLLSPQKITFAGNRDGWIEMMAQEATPAQLKAIRELKQFGNAFEAGAPKTLPFDVTQETVSFGDRRYAVDRAPVQWNDQHGEWTLVLMGDLDQLMPLPRRAAIGAVTGGTVMILCILFLVWRRRLDYANLDRQRALADLQAQTARLESDSETKTYLAGISADLHQAASLPEFARRFMFHITPRVGVDYGEFYAFDQDSGLLQPVGSHGAARDGMERVAIGQGLVGQCAKDRKPIVITDSPGTELRIVWGAGSASPRSIILLPLVQAEHLLGVIVLAALQPVDEARRTLLEAMLPMVTANLEILERNLATRRQAEVLQQQQTRLQETEAWYRSIIESSPDGMLVIDGEGVIILSNPRLEAMFGYDKGELNGRKIEALVPPAVRGHHPELRNHFLRTGTSRTMGATNSNLRGVRKDGSEFPVEVGLSTLPALGGRSACACASVRDVTERKQVEQLIAQERERLQAIIDASPVNVAITTRGIIKFANAMAIKTMGVKVGDPSPQLYVNPAERDTLLAILKRDGIVKNHEIQMYDSQRRVLDLLVTYQPISYGGEDGILAWLMDITERKQGEVRLRQVLEDSPAAVTIVEEDGTQVFSNRRLAELLGVPLDEMKDRRTAEFWAVPEERPVFLEKLKQAGRVDDYEVRMRCDDGRTVWVLLNTRWIEYGGQRLLLSWLYDITQRKEAEDALREQMADLERFSRLTTDREEKMIALKEEINGLLEQTGHEKKYKIVV